jgi:dienelactone hydrolase
VDSDTVHVCTRPTNSPSKYSIHDRRPNLTKITKDITGSRTATTALLAIYDIFGNTPQTTQGADILAERLNGLILIPDFFDGNGAKPEWFPTDTIERHGLLMDFVVRKANWTEAAKGMPDLLKVYREFFPGVNRWGAYGLCWGGKVLALASGMEEGCGFGGTLQVHPG